MSGLLALLGLGVLIGASVKDSSRKDMRSMSSRKWADINNNDIYLDGYGNYRSTKTNEIVAVQGFKGANCGYSVVGMNSGHVYTKEKSEAEKEQERFEEALEYCKEHNIKYLQWYFPINNISRDRPDCTGIEVETGKKYACLRDGYNNHTLIYLENEPHYVHSEYGMRREFDAVHNGSEQDYRNFLKALKNRNIEEANQYEVLHCLHGDKSCSNDYWYYTKKHHITKEEYDERLNELEEYPIKFYKWK